VTRTAIVRWEFLPTKCRANDTFSKKYDSRWGIPRGHQAGRRKISMTPNTAVGTQHPPEGMQPSEAIVETIKETDVQAKPNEQVTSETPTTAKGIVKVDDCACVSPVPAPGVSSSLSCSPRPQPGGGYYLYGSQVTPVAPHLLPGYDVNSFAAASSPRSTPRKPLWFCGQYGGFPTRHFRRCRTSGSDLGTV
jgi:hypothetical protein